MGPLVLIAAAVIVYSVADPKAAPTLVPMIELPTPSGVSDAPILPAKVEAGGDKGDEHETATVGEKPMMLDTAKPAEGAKKKKKKKDKAKDEKAKEEKAKEEEDD